MAMDTITQTCPGYQVRLLQGSFGYLNMNMLIKPVGHMQIHYKLQPVLSIFYNVNVLETMLTEKLTEYEIRY